MAEKTSTLKLIPLREVSRILKVHKETLRRWDNKGKFKSTRQGTRKDRFYKPSDVIHLLQERK